MTSEEDNEIGASRRKSIYNNRIREFESSTSAHGLPHIAASKTRRAQILWILVVLICISIFMYQAYLVITKYRLREKIMNVEMDAFEESLEVGMKTKQKTENDRMKREILNSKKHPLQIIPALVSCHCDDTTKECIILDADHTCVCEYDFKGDTAWPCYEETAWKEELCVEDHSPKGVTVIDVDEATKNISSKEVEVKIVNGIEPISVMPVDPIPCLCIDRGGLKPSCLDKSKMYVIGESKPPWMLPQTTTNAPPTTTETTVITTETTTPSTPITTTTTEDPVFKEAMGFEGLTDQVAIITKGKENVLFSMVALPEEERVKAGYQKNEFVRMCSFNGKECDMSHFRIFVDPSFGNCYTFNYDKKFNLTSSRAGPMYGLRLMAYINRTDFLRTTESAGLRLAIHPQDQVPFPDSFGYSAPTGFSSSFAIHAKRFSRLSQPYGSCVQNGKTGDFIYRNYAYSVEGCFRSCFQHLLVSECGCADPRYPIPNGSKPCSAENGVARNCIDHLFNLESSKDHCVCPNPCNETDYIMTYSASQWPSGSFEVADCTDGPKACVLQYQRHAALVEVFYDQLSYEYLRESISYSWVNLMADFGGHLGLWMGFSVITVIEFLLFLWDLLFLCCQKREIKRTCKESRIESERLKSEKCKEMRLDLSDLKSAKQEEKKDLNGNNGVDDIKYIDEKTTNRKK